MKEMKTETVFQDYEAPQVEIVEVEVEQGFEASGGGPNFSPFGGPGGEDDWG